MRNTHVGVGIGLVVGALTLQIPAALAADGSDLDISSRNASPGSTVTVTTTACGTETYGKGESEVAGAFHLFAGENKGELTGKFTLPDEPLPSTDTVTVKCPPRVKVTDTYDLTSDRPDGAVEAGFGDPQDAAPQIAVGGMLIAAAAAGWMVRVRHRSPGNRT